MRMSFKSAATATAIVTHLLYQLKFGTVTADTSIHLVRARAASSFSSSSKYTFKYNTRKNSISASASASASAFQLKLPASASASASLYPGSFNGRRDYKRNLSKYSYTHHQAPYKYSAPTISDNRLFSSGSSSSEALEASFKASPLSPSSPSIQMHHFNTVKSTQDEARRILKDKDKHVPHEGLAITASSQTNGRGTNGRSWIGGSQTGNVFLTIAIPSDDLVIPLTLFPLQIGTLLTQRVSDMLLNHNRNHNHKNVGAGVGGAGVEKVKEQEQVQDPKVEEKDKVKVTVKWPNDVLVNQKKIAGVLIESDQDHSGCYYYLVGIGINYKYAPVVNTNMNGANATDSQRGREATCICDYIPCNNAINEDGNEDDNDNDAISTTKAMELGQNVAKDVMDWVKLQKTWDGAADAIVPNWERHFECGTKYIMRDDPNQEVVTSVGIEKDGQLRVKGMNGVERLLCSDYLL